MRLLQVKTLEELKSFGSFREVRQSIQSSLGRRLSLKVRGWKELLEAVNQLQVLEGNITEESNQVVIADKSSLYFKSEAARIIYALLELDGEQRLKELKISRAYYQDLDKAKKWRNELARIIHPDKCEHPKAALATNKLTELFENMVGK
jgi:hypothetical protein